MKKYFVIPVIFAICLSSFSCKKKGENQGLTDSDKQTFDLMSSKEGSWWLYQADDRSVFYRHATDKDSVVEGLTFKYYYRIDTTSGLKERIPEYFGKNKDLYTTLIDLNGGNKDYITFILLKDNCYVGQEWSNAETKKISGFNVDMAIESKVKSISENWSYNGKDYDSVIHIYSDLKARIKNVPPYIKCGALEVWIKKGVGVLRQKGNINVIELVKKEYSDNLLDYHIEP